VIGIAPEMYEDIWTAGKVMYKLEPIVRDGGRLIIVAPHVKQVSLIHGEELKAIGYHTRDYFLAQWERFRDFPGGILAHSTHVKGGGTYEDGVERPRIEVILATGIPADECAAINLGHMTGEEARALIARAGGDPDTLVVPHAGEILHRPAVPEEAPSA
jgi:hypothetical protein